jgi:hypothetical protein
MLLVLASLALCACDSGNRVTRTIQDATVPQDSTSSFDEARRRGTTLHYSWQFTTQLDWPRYAAWVTAKMDRQGFRRTPGENLSFVRYDGPDLYRLDFARGEPDAPTRVLVSLVVMPD